MKSLKAEDITKVKEAFIKNKAPRFMKYFFPHQPYGRQKLFVEKLVKASLRRLASLIRVCAYCCKPRFTFSGTNARLS